MSTDTVPSKIIEKERKKLLEILEQDPDSILDILTSRWVISEEEYKSLENVTDPLKKSQKLLILVQEKGEVSCQHFLKCFFSTFPDAATIWDLKHEKKKVFEDVLSRLNMDRSRKLLPEFVKQFSVDHGYNWTPKSPGDLAWNFLMKVQALDVMARESILRHRASASASASKGELLTRVENLELEDIETINPLDVLCASMLCSDSSLQREVMSNMYQCQFALPLLLPDAENNKSILMRGAMKDIVKKQPTQPSGDSARDTENFLILMKMPVISFVRLGCCSFSKSRILNTLLCPAQLKPRKIFLHQDSSILVLPRQISDGLVEITWCFPDSDHLKENPSFFQKPVAVANLRGNLESFWTQFGFLLEISSAIFFFTDYLGEKEWNLLMFLGETTIERCYFVLSPQARESEEAQIFQKIMKLKPSQLLFLEREEAGDRGRNMEHLQAALQEVMSSSLKCVSVEDMAFLARELGIQVDEDYENAEGIQLPPSENMAETTEQECQERQSQAKSPSGSSAQIPFREAGMKCGVSENPQNFHPIPVFMSYPQNSWPLPIRIGDNFNQISPNTPWRTGSHVGSKQRSKWFQPLGFQSTGDHGRHKSFGSQYFQPQRFYSGERFTESSRSAQGHHRDGILGSPPKPVFQHVCYWPEKSQTMGAPERSGLVILQVGRFQALGSWPAGAAGKACRLGTQSAEASGKFTRTTTHKKDPHHQAAAIGKLLIPASQQGAQLKTQGEPLNPAFQIGPCPMSNSNLLSSFQLKSALPNPYQVKYPQPKPCQPVPSQPKPTLIKHTQPQPSQPKPSHSKPSHSKPSQPMLSQSRSSQFKPSKARPSQAKVYNSRAGPKSVGKH
ncbi:caspase recruitment domain-containing protein 6 isoform X2 [Dasypus novemcinctus]|uniref:caspase recruitment domain-containing protein 6 isoform X2 n=1 Tax=Dasypus novemcinctus TaxID=9361 RepID=UPI000C821DE5|nr:caspase recruitment domain-containing protein 6 isoform X2 [Dasypus novemcinctus]